MFIHDAFNELIACGHTRIESSELRAKVNDLHKVAPRSSHSGFEKQLEVRVMSQQVNNRLHYQLLYIYYMVDL